MSEIFVDYHGCALTHKDLSILKCNGWLEDSHLTFFFEKMQREIAGHDSRILFMSPIFSQLIKSSTQDISLFLEPFAASKKELILLPVNDNEGDEEGGSHWSILAFSKADDAFFVIDSLKNRNSAPAFKTIEKLKVALNCPFADIHKKATLQQNNTVDCGAHAIFNAANVAHHFMQHGTVWTAPQIESEKGPNMRRELVDQVLEVKKGSPAAVVGTTAATTATTAVTQQEESVRMQLARALQRLPIAKLKHRAAVKRIVWGGMTVANSSPQELKTHLNEIIKMTASARTLGEILNDFETKQNQLMPARPATALMTFVLENQLKIHDIEKAKHPEKKIQFPDILKAGKAIFDNLPSETRLLYEKSYQSALENYKNTRKQSSKTPGKISRRA